MLNVHHFKKKEINYNKWSFLIFTAITLLSVVKGQTTIFYLIYFFWWNEFIRIIIDIFFIRRTIDTRFLLSKNRKVLFSSLYVMGIYAVFIVVFFGFIAASKNVNLLMINMKTLVFQNWFFNINLIIVVVERLYLHKNQQSMHISFGVFTVNMIVLHVSIILGGLLMFFVVKNYPNIFTPENLWGSVIIVLPFLVLKMVAENFSSSMQQL